MKFSTPIEIPRPAGWAIEPQSRLLFVGSCFADSIGQRFVEHRWNALVNPRGTMYNPASVLHTIEKTDFVPDVAFVTLGTNHVYILKETNEIVDNCEKRPQSLFREEELSVDQCADYLEKVYTLLYNRNPRVRLVLTVSPIRYAKYGFHGSQLSKATLLLAADRVGKAHPEGCFYFPAYEILMDELRDYRFYAPDMLHPSAQAVDYIWERLSEVLFSAQSQRYVAELRPILAALNHRPFDPDSPASIAFKAEAATKLQAFLSKYFGMGSEPDAQL